MSFLRYAAPRLGTAFILLLLSLSFTESTFLISLIIFFLYTFGVCITYFAKRSSTALDAAWKVTALISSFYIVPVFALFIFSKFINPTDWGAGLFLIVAGAIGLAALIPLFFIAWISAWIMQKHLSKESTKRSQEHNSSGL